MCQSVNSSICQFLRHPAVVIASSRKCLSGISIQPPSVMTTIQSSPSFITNAGREARRATIVGAAAGAGGGNTRVAALVAAGALDVGGVGLRGAAKPTIGASAGRLRGDEGAFAVVLTR